MSTIQTKQKDIPPLIAEACKNCIRKSHLNPLVKCTAYGGYNQCTWIDIYHIFYKCIDFTKESYYGMDGSKPVRQKRE